MTSSWQHLQGVVLAGRYLLQQWVGDSENAALFRTFHGSDARPAVLKLIPAGGVALDVQLSLWRRMAALSHPNLLPLLDSGQVECDGEPFLFAVFEYPDETLQAALDDAPLSAPEALEILRALLTALSYIHSQGLVHAAIDARHVVAVGNQIKLWSDTIHPPTRSETDVEDVAAVGDLLFHVLTGHTIGSAALTDLPELPDPFRSIIQNTSRKPPQRRWTLSDIANAVDPKPVEPKLVEPQPVPRVPRSLALRSVFFPPAFPRWAYGALAAMLAALGFLFLPKFVPPKVASSPPPSQAPVPAPVDVPPPPPPTAEPVVLPLPPSPATADSPVVPPPDAPSAPQAREVWRVVAYTYFRYANAARKANSINQRWPAGKAAVFSPNGPNSTRYLVVLGGIMDREQAVRLLKIARGKGMPRDIYIQNYTR
jgi:hypothetical protein